MVGWPDRAWGSGDAGRRACWTTCSCSRSAWRPEVFRSGLHDGGL